MYTNGTYRPYFIFDLLIMWKKWQKNNKFIIIKCQNAKRMFKSINQKIFRLSLPISFGNKKKGIESYKYIKMTMRENVRKKVLFQGKKKVWRILLLRQKLNFSWIWRRMTIHKINHMKHLSTFFSHSHLFFYLSVHVLFIVYLSNGILVFCHLCFSGFYVCVLAKYDFSSTAQPKLKHSISFKMWEWMRNRWMAAAMEVVVPKWYTKYFTTIIYLLILQKANMENKRWNEAQPSSCKMTHKSDKFEWEWQIKEKCWTWTTNERK